MPEIIDIVYREDKSKEWRFQLFVEEDACAAEFHIHRPFAKRKYEGGVYSNIDMNWMSKFIEVHSPLQIPKIVETFLKFEKGTNFNLIKQELNLL